MEFINTIIDGHNIPILTAFLLGVLTSISPCPLATNITAVAFISKNIKNPKNTILSGICYTLGRAISYTLLATIIYFGFSGFQVSRIFQGWGDKVLGPVLIIIGLLMLNIIKVNIKTNNEKIEKIKIKLAKKGYLGSIALGVLFALAFCPYSGVLFFGALMPLTLTTSGGLLLPIIFAIGTGLPVILFSILLVVSMKAVNKAFNVTQKIEKYLRYLVASIFILSGIYYLQFLIIFLSNL